MAIERRSIASRKQKFIALVNVLPGGDLVLMQASAGIERGTILRPNRQLAKDTKGQTTVACYEDVYDAYRAGIHVRNGYGVVQAVTGSETYDVRQDLVSAREVVRWLLYVNGHTPDDGRFLRQAKQDIEERLSKVRNEHKVTARERFARGTILEDSRGRNNPPAAAMVMGAGIARLLERLQQISEISPPLERRAADAAMLIRSHLELYNEAWKSLNSLRRYTLYGKPDVREIAYAARELEAFAKAFSAVSIRPFCRNAAFTADDLARAAKCCIDKEVPAARAALNKAREGLRWIFALHYLQREILIPLSFLLARIYRRTKQQTKGLRGAMRVQVYREFEPNRFAALRAKLDTFQRKLAKCSDANFAEAVKSRVIQRITLARIAMNAQEWPRARRYLVQAARVL